MFQAFAARGKKIGAIVNLFNVPEAKHYRWTDLALEKADFFVKDKDGQFIRAKANSGERSANFSNPLVQQSYFRQLNELLKVVASYRNFDGVDLWIDAFGSWRDLQAGYDSGTLRRFSEENKVVLPAGQCYEELTSPGALRNRWIAWRCKQVTDFVANTRRTMNQFTPKRPLRIVSSEYHADHFDAREQKGIAPEQWNQIPGVETSPLRYPTMYRWGLHRDGKERECDLVQYDLDNKARFLKSNSVGLTSSWLAFFETFSDSPSQKEFPGYFQCADVKPHGRFFLKEPAYCVAAFDAQNIILGGQSLGTFGREAYAREFARAFRALPARRCRTELKSDSRHTNSNHFFIRRERKRSSRVACRCFPMQNFWRFIGIGFPFLQTE
ncbi:MAG: hypothetical protein PHS41_03110 [Victivallaceae bacterium]|nr:hypothetical protein [Victivallaceae bacterium]